MGTPRSICYETDERILLAIEAVAGDTLDDGLDDNHEPVRPPSRAHLLWANGGREAEIRTALDHLSPGWRDDAPLSWWDNRFEGEPA